MTDKPNIYIAHDYGYNRKGFAVTKYTVVIDGVVMRKADGDERKYCSRQSALRAANREIEKRIIGEARHD